MTKRLLRSVDRHLIAIGVAMLAIGLLGTMLSAVRDLVPLYLDDGSGFAKRVSLPGLALHVLMAFAGPFAYNSVLLLVTGVIVRRGRATLVGFEGAESMDLFVDRPVAGDTVWLGRRYPNAFDAELAAAALANRLSRAD